MMTQEEARTKWCPMTRMPMFATFSHHPVAGNTLRSGERGSVCFGSECMMWRWLIVTTTADKLDGLGYCGLAGRPETLERR